MKGTGYGQLIARIISISLLFSLACWGTSFGQSAKLEKEKKANSKQADKYWDIIRRMKEDKEEISITIEKIDKRIEAKNAQIDGINAQLSAAEEKLNASESEKVKLEQRVGEHKLRLSERARTLYMQGELSYIDVMFNVADFGELVDRMFFIQTILEQDQRIVTDTKAAQVELEQKVKAMAYQMEEIKKIQVSLEEERKNLQRISDEQRITNEAIDKDIATYLKEIRELEAANKKIMRDIANIEKSKGFAGVWEGDFARPCKGTITSPYGSRIHPIYKKRKMHTGVDIGAPKGTPIQASGDGKVIIAKYYGGYGNTVVIDHGKSRTTLYGHMSKITIKEGTNVKRGDKIGEVGSTGISTGNHCHFEVRIKGDPVDPTKSMK